MRSEKEGLIVKLQEEIDFLGKRTSVLTEELSRKEFGEEAGGEFKLPNGSMNLIEGIVILTRNKQKLNVALDVLRTI